MGGFLGGYVGPGLTAATQVVSGYQGAQAQAKKEQQARALQQLALQRQAHNDEIANALKGAQADALRAPVAKPKRSTATFKLNGKATLGSMDEGGTYYDAAGTPVTAGIEPFEKPTAQQHIVDPVTGEVVFVDPMHPPQGLKVHPAPKPDNFTPVTVGGEDGTPPVIKPFSTKHGTVGPEIGKAKPAVTRVESATNTAAKARLEAGIFEMNGAHNAMADFEGKLASGAVHINAGQQVLARVANAFTHDDPLSQLTQSGTLALLNQSDPELARYVRRGLSFAEGESMISQRPSDFRTKMAAFLSTAASGASADMIHDIQSRRASILNPLNRITPAAASQGRQGAPAGNVDRRGGQPSHAQQLWDAAVAKHGQAKVEAEVGPRPQDDDE